MRTPSLVAIALAACASGCGSAGERASTTTQGATDGPAYWCADTACIYVDGAAGVDRDGCGHIEDAGGFPCQTVTRALQYVTAPMTIIVSGDPRRFNQMLGETYPIVLPANVSLVGDERVCFPGSAGADVLRVQGPVDPSRSPVIYGVNVGGCVPAYYGYGAPPRVADAIYVGPGAQISVRTTGIASAATGLHIDGGSVPGIGFVTMDDVDDGVVCRSDTDASRASTLDGDLGGMTGTMAYGIGAKSHGLVAGKGCNASGAIGVSQADVAILAEADASVALSTIGVDGATTGGVVLRASAAFPSLVPSVSIGMGTIQNTHGPAIDVTAGTLWMQRDLDLHGNTCDLVASAPGAITSGLTTPSPASGVRTSCP